MKSRFVVLSLLLRLLWSQLRILHDVVLTILDADDAHFLLGVDLDAAFQTGLEPLGVIEPDLDWVHDLVEDVVDTYDLDVGRSIYDVLDTPVAVDGLKQGAVAVWRLVDFVLGLHHDLSVRVDGRERCLLEKYQVIWVGFEELVLLKE